MVSKQPLGCLNQIIETNLSFKIELSVPFTNITFDIHEGLPLSFWCFVRFTLFNLQGTRREGRRFFKSTTARPVCQVLFHFFRNFFALSSAQVFCGELIYITTPKPLCQELFSLPEQLLSPAFPLSALLFRSSLHTIPLPALIVNPLFPFFSSFFRLPFPLGSLAFPL